MYSGDTRLPGVRFPANGAIPLGWIPVLSFDEFRDTLVNLLQIKREVKRPGMGRSVGASRNGRAWVSALFAYPLSWEERKNPDHLYRLVAIIGGNTPGWEGVHRVISTTIGQSYPSLTLLCPQVHMFERLLEEKWQITPEGHPWRKPVRFPLRRFQPLDGAGDGGESDTGESSDDLSVEVTPRAERKIGITDFYSVEGEEIHEVAVGPVHAGVIEPGHFRFQCHGEEVLHLEISLGYQHRGIEHLLRGGPDARSLPAVEVIAGDTTIGHTTAFCRIVEALTGLDSQVKTSSLIIRALALELERIANHVGDLGAIAGDIGYLPTSSFCGRIRGDVLNLTADICGNRFGRGLVCPGGTGYFVDSTLAARLRDLLKQIFVDARDAISALWDTPSVLARIETTGTVSRETCMELGLVGVAARACGVKRDVRVDHPSGRFMEGTVPVASWGTGDVYGRANVRWQEITNSVEYIMVLLGELEKGAADREDRAGDHGGQGDDGRGDHHGADWTQLPLVGQTLAFAVEEGWRGEICHVAITDQGGRFSQYEVIDPSVHNWTGLAMAMRGQQVSDFPLCNKSFNLSYCGHDL